MIQVNEEALMHNPRVKEGYLKLISEMLLNTTDRGEPIYIYGGGLGGGKSVYWETQRECLLNTFPDPASEWDYIYNDNTYKPNKFYLAPIVSVNPDSLISKLVRKL
jgi:hypothetical protein